MNRPQWWVFATEVASQVTTREPNVPALDAETASAIRSSRVFAAASAAFGAAGRVWSYSVTREKARAFTQAWRSTTTAGTIRSVAWCVAIAMATALLLQVAEFPEGGPYRWLLPAALGLLAVLAGLSAPGLARGWGARRSR